MPLKNQELDENNLVISMKSFINALDSLDSYFLNTHTDLLRLKESIVGSLRLYHKRYPSKELKKYINEIDGFSSFKVVNMPLKIYSFLFILIIILLLNNKTYEILGVLSLLLIPLFFLISTLLYLSFLKNKKLRNEKILSLKSHLHYSIKLIENS